MAAPFPQLPPLSGRRSALWAEYWQQRLAHDAGHRQALLQKNGASQPSLHAAPQKAGSSQPSLHQEALAQGRVHGQLRLAHDVGHRQATQQKKATSQPSLHQDAAVQARVHVQQRLAHDVGYRPATPQKTANSSQLVVRDDTPVQIQVTPQVVPPIRAKSASRTISISAGSQGQGRTSAFTGLSKSQTSLRPARRQSFSGGGVPIWSQGGQEGGSEASSTASLSPRRPPRPPRLAMPKSAGLSSTSKPLRKAEPTQTVADETLDGNLRDVPKVAAPPKRSLKHLPEENATMQKALPSHLPEENATMQKALPPLQAEDNHGLEETAEVNHILEETTMNTTLELFDETTEPPKLEDGHQISDKAEEVASKSTSEIVPEATLRQHSEVPQLVTQHSEENSSGSESSTSSDALSTGRGVDESEDHFVFKSKTPMDVFLPAYYPDLIPLPGLHDSCAGSISFSRSATLLEPSFELCPPAVRSAGPRKLVVNLELPQTAPVAATYSLRLRRAGSGDEGWRAIDLDSGRIAQSQSQEDSWKHRAFVMQPGLRVLTFCVLESSKSSQPVIGTVVAYYPGVLVVDFDLVLSEQNKRMQMRQRVPQDWVVLAALPKTMGTVMWELLEKQMNYAERTRGKGLWKVAKQKVFERIVRANRHCAILWQHWIREPEPSCRIAVACTVELQRAQKTDSSLSVGAGVLLSSRASQMSQESTFEVPKKSAYTWWPASLADKSALSAKLESLQDDKPSTINRPGGIGVVLEPNPRIQTVRRSWLSEDGGDADLARRNACIGQRVLSYYHAQASTCELCEEHAPPRTEGDVTLRFGDVHVTGQFTMTGLFNANTMHFSSELRSERAVSGRICRELVSPAEVLVDILCTGKATPTQVSLTTVYDVHPHKIKIKGVKEDRRKLKLVEWLILRNERQARFDVIAQRQAITDPRAAATNTVSLDGGLESLRLEPGLKVSFFAQTATLGRKKLLKGKVSHIHVGTTHYEILFDDQIPSTASVPTNSLMSYISEAGNTRIRNPQILLHDLPEDLDAAEISVGLARSPDDLTYIWSLPSKPCDMHIRDSPLLPPLGPTLWPVGVARAEMRWFMPNQSPGLCFRVRLRKSGDPEWCLLDSDGVIREQETSFAWKSRLVPLVNGLWGSAFGDLDGRKSSTPGTVIIHQVGAHGNTVNVQFVSHSKELCIGSELHSDLACTQCPEVKHDEQRIPIDWLESVFVKDEGHFFRGSPLAHCRHHQQAVFRSSPSDAERLSPSDAGRFSVQLDGDKAPVPDTYASSTWLKSAGAEKDFTAVLHSGRRRSKKDETPKNEVFTASLQVGALQIQGLRAETKYEVGVQAMTDEGWTPWTTGLLEMPRIGYVPQQLVHETKSTALFYTSPLLPQAFFKEYDKCAETLESTLSTARFEKLKHTLSWQETYNAQLSRHLVDMEGPIRMNMEADELRKLAERRADLNYRDQSTGRTPLTYACEYGWCVKKHIIEELLDLRADVNSMTDNHRTALAIAAEGGYDDIVEILLLRGADATRWSLHGKTALLGAEIRTGMGWKEIKGVSRSRARLRKDRVEWDIFEKTISEQSNGLDAAKAFLELVFPGGAALLEEEKDGSKRISRHDRLRLREQIMEAAEHDAENKTKGIVSKEEERRGNFCADLLLSQMRLATLDKHPQCGKFTRYLLFSGAMRYCMQDAQLEAKNLLGHYEEILLKKRDSLKVLPTLTTEAEMFVGFAAKKCRTKFLGRPLHQWHAHNDLPWLTERNVVGAYEALVSGGACRDIAEFCTWIGELEARISASAPGHQKHERGAWDDRLPPLFWGVAYSKFLLGEASRAAPIFHGIANKLVDAVNKDKGVLGVKGVKYTSAPNKSYSRVMTKQIEYATCGLLALHVALNLMPGCFQMAIRADLDEQPQFIKHVESTSGGVLILAAVPDKLENAADALNAVARNCEEKGQERPPILVYVQSKADAETEKELQIELEKFGADAVVFQKGPIEIDWVKPAIEQGLGKALECCRLRSAGAVTKDVAAAEAAMSERAGLPSVDQAQLLFDIQKNRTYCKEDLLCAGGLLDLVRGSITCATEDEVKRIYELAVTLTLNNDNAEVLRVKNGFHTPTVGGYSDLKLFMVVSNDSTKICHICELQVHLQEFLECKKYTHMPYVIDRGDFNAG